MREDTVDPPIHTEYSLSGGATTLILMVDGANAVSSFVTRSKKKNWWNMAVQWRTTPCGCQRHTPNFRNRFELCVVIQTNVAQLLCRLEHSPSLSEETGVAQFLHDIQNILPLCGCGEREPSLSAAFHQILRRVEARQTKDGVMRKTPSWMVIVCDEPSESVRNVRRASGSIQIQ